MADKRDKLKLVQQLLLSAKNSIHSAEQMLRTVTGTSSDVLSAKDKVNGLSSFDDGKVIEGVFDGQKMIGPDDKEYKVPENYASKSKLVEGDTLKLTIAEDGGFIFKQIGPVPRKQAVGTLVKEEEGFKIVIEGKSYKVLQASVTYYKASDGDKVSVVIPENQESQWAALENVVETTGESNSAEASLDKQEEQNNETIEQAEGDVGTDISGKENISGAISQNNAEVDFTGIEPAQPETVPAKPEEPTEGVKELEI